MKQQRAALAASEGADPFAGVVTTPKETAPCGFISRAERVTTMVNDVDSSQGAPFELRSITGITSLPPSSKYRSRPRKGMNVVQENLQKIDKIDRGHERSFASQNYDVAVVTSVIDPPHIPQVMPVEMDGEHREGSPGHQMNTTHQTHIIQDHELAASSMTHNRADIEGVSADLHAAPATATDHALRNIVQTREADGNHTEGDAVPAGSAQTHYTSEAMVGIGSAAGDSFMRRAPHSNVGQNIRDGRNSVPTEHIRQDAQKLITSADPNETEQAVSRIDGDRASTNDPTGAMKIQDTNSKIADSTITTHMAPVVPGAAGKVKQPVEQALTIGFTLKKGGAGPGSPG